MDLCKHPSGEVINLVLLFYNSSFISNGVKLHSPFLSFLAEMERVRECVLQKKGEERVTDVESVSRLQVDKEWG